MVRKFLKQNYSKLKVDHVKRRVLFTDPLFPPTAQSLFHSGRSDLEVVWKRPAEICSNPKLVADGLDPSDLNQGAVGNCWFVAACSALALDQKMWNKVVVDVNEQEWDPNHPEKYAGIFHFRFWQFGEWVDVVIDDWLPTQGGQLIFSKSKSKDEFWSPLLEKAYAKLAGSYEALSGGLTGDALVDFTGGVCEVFALQSGDLVDDEEKCKELFDELVRSHEHKVMISCSIELEDDDEPPEVTMDCGLVKGHTYTVTDIRKVKLASQVGSFLGKNRLLMIKLRNPWGQKEWNGAWSDGSEEWKFPESEMGNIEPLEVKDDGEFWMEFSDWLKWFTHYSVCQIVNTSVFSLRKRWRSATFHGQWREKTAGGCYEYADTFFNNPQYSFTLRNSEEVMVSCMQKNPCMSMRGREGDEGPATKFPIGFLIMKVEENRTFRVHSMDHHKEAGLVTHINRRSNFGRFMLEQGRYVIVPSTFEPNQEKEFLLRLYSERNVHAVELKKDNPTIGLCGFLFFYCIKPYCGQVIFHLHNAEGLIKKGAGADPYCKVTCGSKTVVSPIRKGTLEPTFDNQFIFYVRNPEDAMVKVQILHRGTLNDIFMGQVSTTLPVADSGGVKHTMKLMEKGSKSEMAGSVSFTLNHYSNLQAT